MDNFLVYKIEYKGLVYVGQTDNIKHRQECHRSSCFNKNSPEYNYKKNRLLREAGIKKDEIILIPLVKDLDEIESIYYENIWYYKLNANLNSCIPGRTAEQYYIDNRERDNEKFNCFCGGKYTKNNKSVHLKTNRHLKFLSQVNE